MRGTNNRPGKARSRAANGTQPNTGKGHSAAKRPDESGFQMQCRAHRKGHLYRQKENKTRSWSAEHRRARSGADATLVSTWAPCVTQTPCCRPVPRFRRDLQPPVTPPAACPMRPNVWHLLSAPSPQLWTPWLHRGHHSHQKRAPRPHLREPLSSGGAMVASPGPALLHLQTGA